MPGRTLAYHPLNLGLRFLLELSMLVAIGRWGWQVGGVLLAAGLPILAATLWGVFATPNDPSRSGKTVVATPGPARLLLELALFAGAALGAHAAGWPIFAFGLAGATTLHYALSLERVRWLLGRTSPDQQA